MIKISNPDKQGKIDKMISQIRNPYIDSAGPFYLAASEFCQCSQGGVAKIKKFQAMGRREKNLVLDPIFPLNKVEINLQTIGNKNIIFF